MFMGIYQFIGKFAVSDWLAFIKTCYLEEIEIEISKQFYAEYIETVPDKRRTKDMSSIFCNVKTEIESLLF